MIEVLVASTILVVIVMMLAMLFQQTSLSWRTGVKRADAYMAIRSAIGAIQRDASKAVDERVIPLYLRNKLGGGQRFSNTLRFYTLSASGYRDSDNNGRMDLSEIPYRALSYITYNMDGKRTECVLKADGSKEDYDDSNVLDFIATQSSPNKPKTMITAIDPEFSGDSAGLPLYLKIQARVTYSGNALEIGAASAGPDKKWDTKDDIQTWQ